MPFWSKRANAVDEQVEPLPDAERAWVTENVRVARSAMGGELDPEALDDLWARLQADEELDPNDSVNLVGLALGQLLVDRSALDWVVLTDAHGTEIAVRGPSDFTVFPTNFVAKRYETGETGFIAPFVAEVGRTLRALG
jgi:Domain of unknown function (DUF3806)